MHPFEIRLSGGEDTVPRVRDRRAVVHRVPDTHEGLNVYRQNSAKDQIAGCLPVAARHSLCTTLSTPLGLETDFYEVCMAGDEPGEYSCDFCLGACRES